jgi:hypothetical protein
MTAEYQHARMIVSNWELYSVLSPGEVERLESKLSDLYRTIQDVSRDLSSIAAAIEFQGKGDNV